MKISEVTLLKGKHIEVGIGKIYPPTLGDIADIGEDKYNQYLNAICVNKRLIESNDIEKAT